MQEFDFAFVEVRLLQDFHFYSSRHYPLRSGVPFPFPLFHYPFLFLCILLFSLILCWCHRPRLRPIRCMCLGHRATRWCSAVTVTHFGRRLLRRRLPEGLYLCTSHCWCYRPRLRPILCRCPCHRATHWCSAATFISSLRAALRRPH